MVQLTHHATSGLIHPLSPLASLTPPPTPSILVLLYPKICPVVRTAAPPPPFPDLGYCRRGLRFIFLTGSQSDLKRSNQIKFLHHLKCRLYRYNISPKLNSLAISYQLALLDSNKYNFLNLRPIGLMNSSWFKSLLPP